MTVLFVKPAPGLPAGAAKILKSDTDVGLLDASGNVPDAGMPWPNGGITLRLLTDGAILRADDPIFAKPADSAPAEPTAAPSAGTAPVPAIEPTTAH